ncbi:MAG TPA: ABC transporter permease [Gemmatimonadaceae bacterium]|nr:ABC transporter permease [Gemmatimonadaceae bacterium]
MSGRPLTGPPAREEAVLEPDAARGAPALSGDHPAGDGHDEPLYVIEARGGLGALDLRELWHYRDLLYFLTWREISIRYKQTLLGFAWAIIQPLTAMVVFTVFLGRLAKVPSDGIPYPVFSYLGLLPWTYFANAVTRSGSSLVANANLLSKVYFPRVLIPVSGVLSAAVDFAIAFVVLIGLMLWYGITPAWTTLWLIPLTLLTALASAGVGMWLASLNVKYRDVQHAVPFLIQVWMYATPVVYPASIVPAKWRTLFALNPLAGIVEAYRAATLGRPLDWSTLGVSTAATLGLLAAGTIAFRRMERQFADIV